jgi:hypothetical protein
LYRLDVCLYNTCFLSANWNDIGYEVLKNLAFTLPLRFSAGGFVGFNVPDVGGICCCATDGFPRTDWARGRDCDNVLSFIVTAELFEGLGLYKHVGSISWPKKESNYLVRMGKKELIYFFNLT